jgi:hypothetical protein
MEGLERSSELSGVGTAVEHSRSCIWTRYSGFKSGLLQPALRTWSRVERIVFDSSVSLRPFHRHVFGTVRVPDFLPAANGSQTPQRLRRANQLSLPGGGSTLRWPPKDGQSSPTVATHATGR